MNRIIQILAILSVVISTSSYGTPVVASEYWDSGTADWKYTLFDGSSTTSAADPENSSGALLLRYTDSSAPRVASLYATSGNFLGNFNAEIPTGMGLGVEFNLKTGNSYNPDSSAMWLYFVGNGRTYYLSDTRAQPDNTLPTFTHYSFVIGSQANWVLADDPFNMSNFVGDFGSVTQFGIKFVGAANTDERLIYLDDFEIKVLVPEPETVWMMVMVLASLALTFRGRLTELGNQVKARLVA